MTASRSLLLLSVWMSFGLLVAGVSLAQEKEGDSVDAPDSEPLPTIETLAADWQLNDGFQPWFWDEADGKVWLRISDWDREFLFSYGLSTGLGSNPVGLDRGQLGDQFVCQFRRVGKKVFLVAHNLDYRALSENPIERRAVRESFAESILWGGELAAETNRSVLVDVTGLLTSDLHGVTRKLKATEQGEYSLDETRCGVFIDRSKSFPMNTELEATLTFSGSEAGNLVQQVTPSPQNITLRQHVSFVQLPDDGYQPRVHHPRCASMFIGFSDYAAPIDEPLQKRWVIRHRLQKQNPDAATSPAVEPIVYYVDPGAPELIRDALIEGASWWNEAFEAAGFENAFRVELFPDDADPMDVRFNVIQWVHRSTRGWSYGGSVIDPRTGEIIKGHVTLGSLRVRQDRLIFETMPQVALSGAGCGLIGIAEDTTLAHLDQRIDPVEVALARIRQLSAHEVGHTLGFVHNFAASTYDDRASVMDYPAPRIGVQENGALDLSDAYGVGIGTWDKWSVEYAYREFPADSDEAEQLEGLVNSAIDRGMTFVSDADARPAGAGHPAGNLWDNGADPVTELRHVMNVRRIALSQLGPDDLRPEESLANMQQLLVPVYLHHRFQVDAAAKILGGVEFSYATAGKPIAMQVVPESKQLEALQALLDTLSPDELLIADELWTLIPPPPFSDHRAVERFAGNTSPAFDRETAARVAADLTIGNLLQPQRVSRMGMLQRGNTETFGPLALMVALIDYAWRPVGEGSPRAEMARIVRQSVMDHLMELAASKDSSDAARNAALFGIERVKQYLDQAQRAAYAEGRSFISGMQDQIRRFELRPWPTAEPIPAPPSPPGSPIGDGSNR
ncbi:MAG: zinc-dependent metalloprotease [Pirellulaceae bacterium]